ncbi:Arc family DNA-binding protein [Salmonella enterica]
MSRVDPQLRVRIPDSLKEHLEQKASANKRTLTAEIVDRLEETVVQDQVAQSHNGYQNMASGYEEGWTEAAYWKGKYHREYAVDYVCEHRTKIRSAMDNLLDVLNPSLSKD